MVFWATLLFLQGASLVGSAPEIFGVPENITVMFINPTSVRVSWSTSQIANVEKYDVTYKPTDARVVAVVAGNSEAVTLSNLRADTQYQLVVTAIRNGKKLRSRPIVFRTLEPTRSYTPQDVSVSGDSLTSSIAPLVRQPETYVQIRGVEVGIVLLVLMVWVGAIALFFNRWGKIRMLLPYQPDYKEQLKVPGTGVSNSVNSAHNHNSSQVCSQELTKNQQSASRLAYKVSSTENLPLSTPNHSLLNPNQDDSFIKDTLFKSNPDLREKKKQKEKKQSSLENLKNESLQMAPSLTQHLSLRELNVSSTSLTQTKTISPNLPSSKPLSVTVISGPTSFLPIQSLPVEPNFTIWPPTHPNISDN